MAADQHVLSIQEVLLLFSGRIAVCGCFPERGKIQLRICWKGGRSWPSLYLWGHHVLRPGDPQQPSEGVVLPAPTDELLGPREVRCLLGITLSVNRGTGSDPKACALCPPQGVVSFAHGSGELLCDALRPSVWKPLLWASVELSTCSCGAVSPPPGTDGRDVPGSHVSPCSHVSL